MQNKLEKEKEINYPANKLRAHGNVWKFLRIFRKETIKAAAKNSLLKYGGAMIRNGNSWANKFFTNRKRQKERQLDVCVYNAGVVGMMYIPKFWME